jgi:hypothetical protein
MKSIDQILAGLPEHRRKKVEAIVRALLEDEVDRFGGAHTWVHAGGSFDHVIYVCSECGKRKYVERQHD